MKRYILLLFVGLGLSAAAAELNDTIVKVNNPDSVLLTRNDSTIILRVDGSSNDKSAKFVYTIPTQGTSLVDAAASRWKFPESPLTLHKESSDKKHSMELTAGQLLLGFNLAQNGPKGISSDVWGRNIDVELNLMRFSVTRNRHHCFSLGWSYGWSKIALDGGLAFQLNNGVTTIGTFAENQTPIRSVFRLNRHSFPLLYTYQENGMGLSVGPVLNLNVRPRIYNTYLNAEGKEQQDADKSGIHFTPATLSFYGEIKIKWIGIFARYTPQSMFEKGLGPNVQTLTVGLSFF